MNNKIAILSPFISLAVGIGFESFSKDMFQAIIAAMLCEIILLFIDQKIKLNEMSNLITFAMDGIDYLQDRESVYKYTLNDISRRNMPKVWKELIWKMKNNFHATSYMNHNDSWLQKFAVDALEIQRVQQSVNEVDIKRIFIFENIEEMKASTENMNKQASYGLKVRYILRETINRNSWLKNQSKSIDTIDFGLFDKKIVFLWYLDGQRRIKSGRLLYGEANYKKYSDFYDILWKEGHSFTTTDE